MTGNDIISSGWRRNNLGRSSSPYLLQHISNPVWWQEWNNETLSYAREKNMPLLVSVGYATCHWCHVMAAEAFSDEATATFLNGNFVCVKVDREQRPDIDQYLMDFINSRNGRGGWPLNVFLTPELKPVYGLTYAPATGGKYGGSFLEIATKVLEYIRENSMTVPDFIPDTGLPESTDSSSVISTLETYFDKEHGGFGQGQKFPSHSTLLYLLFDLADRNDEASGNMCFKTLDAMRLKGLTDHLQGGLFRYCTDREWTIPHFEKMLYDQAMALWNYSLAFRITGNDQYRHTADRIIRCITENFMQDGLFITAHDADTHHIEGSTYLWSLAELETVLGKTDLVKFMKSYQVTETGNFEGLNHLIRSNDLPLDEIEDKLLKIRQQREQPFRDEKIVSGLNALLAIAFIQAGRALDQAKLFTIASGLTNRLLEKFWDGNKLAHSLYKGKLQRQDFLSDASAMLAALTFLAEEDPSWWDKMETFASYVRTFRDGDIWIESRNEDFRPVQASGFDHPYPSPVSMAEFGLTRFSILAGNDYLPLEYYQPYQSDFHNTTAMICNGQFHIFTSPQPLPWSELPVNSIQLRGAVSQDCYKGTCSRLSASWKSDHD